MSMHELEDLVEMSVKLLAVSGLSRERLRSLYFNLFELEARFDTSFTHFRNIDELLAARFVYCLSPSEHPEFEAAREYFEALDGFSFIEVPGRELDGGYYNPPYLYCDAGSPLWHQLVARGRLGGSDARPPLVLPIQNVLEEVARLAEDVGDVRLVAYAYRLLLWALLDQDPRGLVEDVAVLRLREIVRRTGALKLDLEEEGSALRDPTPQDLEDLPLVRFWFDLAEPTRPLRRTVSGFERIAPPPATRRSS
jgi:hypothetical protein